MRKSVFLAGIFMLLASPWKVSGSTTGITIKALENIVKYQLGTIRTKVIKKDLEEILEGLEGVVPVDSSEKLDRGDDFLSILLIYEDNEKDKFYFFEKGNEWYMETGNGEFYRNADFITDIIHVEDPRVDGTPFADISTGGIRSLINKDQNKKLYAYAKKEGFYPTDQELTEETEKYISDFVESPNYEEYKKICDIAGYEFEDLIHSQNDWVLNLMINFRFDNLRRVEYMEGIDTIDGVVYDDFSAYKEAFCNKYVYEKAYLNEAYQEP